MNNKLNDHSEAVVTKDLIRMRDAYCKYACHKDKMCEFCSIPLSNNIMGTLIHEARRDV